MIFAFIFKVTLFILTFIYKRRLILEYDCKNKVSNNRDTKGSILLK